MVDIVVEVSAEGRDIATVQRSLTDKSNALLAYLRGQQVQRLITSRVSFTPTTHSQKTGPDKTVGYTGATGVSFRSTPEKAADILAGVLSNGANTIESTNFTPTEEEIAAARRELAADSTRTAIAQAESVAKAAGMKVVGVRKIDVDDSGTTSRGLEMLGGGGGAPPPMTNSFKMLADRYSGPIDTSAGDEELAIRTDVIVAANR